MKIGLLIYGSLETLSGGYLYDRELVKYLRAKGETIQVISLPWRNYPTHLSDNFRYRLPPGLDILVEDELNHPSLLAANTGKHLYPVVSLVHHLRSSERHPAWFLPLYRFVESRYLRSVDAFIYNSRTTKQAVRSLTGLDAPGLIAHPPVNRFGHPLTAAQVAARALEPGPLGILFLGNLIPRKGLHTLLAAMRPAPAKFRLDVIGSLSADPRYSTQMQCYCRDAGLADRVFFHGALTDAALASRLGSAQVLVVPSSYEGFGIVYLEGMGLGLPAVGTTAGAAAEVIKDAETGYLVPAGDAPALSNCLQNLADDRELLRRLSLNALEHYLQQPAWETTAESIRQFLIGLV